MSEQIWYCPDCSNHMGKIIGGELHVNLENVSEVRTVGTRLVLVCKQCGRSKVWFPSDPTIRAMNMLIDAFASNLATTMAREFVRKRAEVEHAAV